MGRPGRSWPRMSEVTYAELSRKSASVRRSSKSVELARRGAPIAITAGFPFHESGLDQQHAPGPALRGEAHLPRDRDVVRRPRGGLRLRDVHVGRCPRPSHAARRGASKLAGGRLLVDAPPRAAAPAAGCRGSSSVDALWVTHDHADHVHGIDDVRAFTEPGRGDLPAWTAHPSTSEQPAPSASGTSSTIQRRAPAGELEASELVLETRSRRTRPVTDPRRGVRPGARPARRAGRCTASASVRISGYVTDAKTLPAS